MHKVTNDVEGKNYEKNHPEFKYLGDTVIVINVALVNIPEVYDIPKKDLFSPLGPP